MKTFREELIEFAENVSVRGASRVVKSKRLSLKIMWSCAIIVCTGVLLWQLAALFEKYSLYPYKTSYGSVQTNMTFPSILICTLQPKLSEIDYDEYLNQEEYFTKITNITRFINSSFNQTALKSLSLSDFIGNVPKNYLISLPKFGIESQQSIPFIIHYKFLDSTETVIDNVNCFLENTSLWGPDFKTCYKFQISNLCNVNIKSLVMIVFTNTIYTSQDDFDFKTAGLNTDGIKVNLASPGMVIPTFDGFNFGPGTDSMVRITMNVKKNLDEPYVPEGCERRKYLDESDGILYSQLGCAFHCVHMQIFENCQCNSPHIFAPKKLKNFHTCANTSLTSRKNELNFFSQVNMTIKAIREWNCFKNVTRNVFISECISSCRQSCADVYYDRVIHTLYEWPHISNQKYFFENFIKRYLIPGTKLYTYYEDYIINIKKFDSGNITLDELNAFFSEDDKIRSNFLQVQFSLIPEQSYLITDSPVYTWESVLSMVGGSLSLWLGVTFMTGVECFEFLINILRAAKNYFFPNRISFLTQSLFSK